MSIPNIIYEPLMQNVVKIVINDAAHKNTLTIEFLDLFEEFLDKAINDPNCNVIVIEGSGGYFCTGMDFGAVENKEVGDDERRQKFVGLLDKFVKAPKVTIAFVDGKAMAGGVGIAAACDLIVATPKSEFSLPEVLWGLLPALILPYITRRLGPNPSLRLMLTGMPIDAVEAKQINLIDSIGTEADLKRLCFRLSKIQARSIAEAKQFLLSIYPLDKKAKRISLELASDLMHRQSIYDNMTRFRQAQRLPWER